MVPIGLDLHLLHIPPQCITFHQRPLQVVDSTDDADGRFVVCHELPSVVRRLEVMSDAQHCLSGRMHSATPRWCT